MKNPSAHAFVLSSSLFALGACIKPVNSKLKAIVSQESLSNATKILDGITYLPFNYKLDGCYARAYYMSMELAVEGIPSSAQFVFSQSGLSIPGHTEKWTYHVAPAFQLAGQSQRIIIDPSMVANGAVPISQWVGMMKAHDIQYTIVPGSIYEGTAEALPRGTSSIVSSVDEMPPFNGYAVADACNSMWKFLGKEGAPATIRSKRAALIRATRSLVTQLGTLGKITGAPENCAYLDVAHNSQEEPAPESLDKGAPLNIAAAGSTITGVEAVACANFKGSNVGDFARDIFDYREGDTSALVKNCTDLQAKGPQAPVDNPLANPN